MNNQMKIHLEGLGAINEANVNIKKISVVAGHNSTGKSTLSKFLYSFLRSNSFNRQEIAYESLISLMSSEFRYISKILRKYKSSAHIPTLKLRNEHDFDSFLETYEKVKSAILSDTEFTDEEMEDFSQHFAEIDDLVDIVEDDSDELYISLMRSMLESEFTSKHFNFYVNINDDYTIDFRNHEFNDDAAFTTKNTIIVNEVFYIDSVSILDNFEQTRLFDRKIIDHFEFLKNNLMQKDSEVFDDKINKDIIELENEIEDVIRGKFIFEHGEFRFVSNNDYTADMQNTSSGIKQLGIIQLLLANRKLKENSFLIIDEPEVNLHPDWQFKLAQILVLIAKRINVSLYLNTHSPLFLESVHAFAEYYDMSDETTYHLSESAESGFNISEVKESDLSRIYENLGDAYFKIDALRLEKELD